MANRGWKKGKGPSDPGGVEGRQQTESIDHLDDKRTVRGEEEALSGCLRGSKR